MPQETVVLDAPGAAPDPMDDLAQYGIDCIVDKPMFFPDMPPPAKDLKKLKKKKRRNRSRRSSAPIERPEPSFKTQRAFKRKPTGRKRTFVKR